MSLKRFNGEITKAFIPLNRFINTVKGKLHLVLVIFFLSLLISPNIEIHAQDDIPTHTISIGIGSIQDSSGEYAIIGESVGPENVIYNVKYSWESSNTKVVKVNKDTGALTGIKAGKATVSVKQALDGETSVVTKWEVTVYNNAKILTEDETIPYGKNTKEKMRITFFSNCINVNATYKIESSNNSIVSFRGTASKKNNFMLSMVTKNAGTATLTIYQVLNGKTIKIGKEKFRVKNAYLLNPEEETIELDSSITMLIDCMDMTKKYTAISSDPSILDTHNGYVEVYPSKEGTVTISFFENGKLFANKKITVKCTPVSKATLSYAYTNNNTKIEPSDDNGITLAIKMEDVFDGSRRFQLIFYTDPVVVNGRFCKASVDDETVCSAKAYDDEGALIVDINARKEGVAKLTITNHLGNIIYSGNITIVYK